MYRTLWNHYLKSLRRNAAFSGMGLFSRLLAGAMLVYLLANLAALGWYIDRPLAMLSPGQPPATSLSPYLLHLFALLLLSRFFLQGAPQLYLQPYRHLPLERHTLARFGLGTSLLSWHNLLPLSFVAAFWPRHVLSTYPLQAALGWLIGFLALLLLSHLLIVVSGGRPWRTPLALGCSALLVLEMFQGDQALVALSATFFDALLESQSKPLVAVVASIAFSLWASDSILANRIAIPASRAPNARPAQRLDRLQSRGLILYLLVLETKLIARHRRPRQLAWAFGLGAVLFFGLFLWRTLHPLPSPYPFFDQLANGLYAFLITGYWLLGYGQLALSWNGHFWDGLLARPENQRAFLWSKLLLLWASVGLPTLACSIPLAFLAADWLGYFYAYALFNAGCGAPLLLWGSSFAPHRLRLLESPFMDFQGTSAQQVVLAMPLILIPLLMATLLDGHLSAALAALGLAGLLGSKWWIASLEKRLQRLKYTLAATLRPLD